MGKHQSSRKQREHSLSHIGQRNQKRVRFYLWNQTSHHKLDINLAESLCSPRVESVREKMENYASEQVQKESASRIISTNNHNSEIEMEVENLVGINDEEDPEKLKEEERGLSCPLPILKNVVADTSVEIETNTLSSTGYSYYGFRYQRSTSNSEKDVEK